MVYFLQEDIEDGFIKVGNANVLYGYHGRIGKLQEGNPRALELIATIPGDKIDSQDLEEQIEQDLQEFHIRGEWYRPTPKVFEYIRKIPNVRHHCYRPGWPHAFLKFYDSRR